jgi:zinc transport system substrate-binding protein
MFNRAQFLAGLVLAAVVAMPLRAEAPRVAADIPPVHALVAQVMNGVGAPDLIVAPGTSPHGYALRPSEARTLQDADLVVWVGPGLTPWLGAALPRIAADAEIVTLETDPATRRLPLRAQADFATGGATDHAHAHAASDGEVADPHMWLDPANGRAWLGVIAQTLSRIDPDNADRYGANAAAAQADLMALEKDLASRLAANPPAPFVVFHDGFQYFESAFGLSAAGAIVLADGSDPSPARIAEIRAVVRDRGVRCAFAEPQLNTALIDTVIDGTDARVAEVDPLGATHPPGPDLYETILRDLVQSLLACAAPA